MPLSKMLVAALTLGAALYAVHTDAKPSHSERHTEANLVPSIEDELTTFKKLGTCSKDRYNLILNMIRLEELGGKAHMELEQSRGNFSEVDVDRMQDIAQIYNSLGSAALENGCLDWARENYLHVIEVYIGSGYAAMRQRAQIGLDDVRAALTARQK